MTKFINNHRLIFLTAWTVYIYVFMEWVFFATKPSLMSYMDLSQKLGIFFLASFILVVPLLAITTLAHSMGSKVKYLTWVARAVPALILAMLTLILFDNFTYTLFKIGVVSSTGFWRGAYGIGFIIVFLIFLKKIPVYVQARSGNHSGSLNYLVLGLFSISTLVFIFQFKNFHLLNDLADTQTASLPNIILLGIDGVDATHMSLYGYERDTTPNLKKLASNALIAENAFSNAGKTGGSLTSILTGKLSTQTRVVFPPDILLGADAYQHLPGILKHLGYHTVQITMQYYGDAYERNVRDGFDIVNGASQNNNPLLDGLAQLGGGGGFYFVGQILVRITDRLQHIFFIKTMQNPYLQVTQAKYALHDDQRIEEMLQYLDESKGPLFLHVHLMDTHGPAFHITRQIFSDGQSQNKDWMPDFYDDTILSSDNYINQLFAYLQKTGKINNTIVILYSDHGMQWNTLERVPLVFWFPDGQYAGRLRENVQLLDIAPTILNYLRIPQPGWMKGQSVINENLSADRQILSANVGEDLLRVTDDRATWVIDETRVYPPFYQLGKVNLVICDQWFTLNLRDPRLTYGTIDGSTAVCDHQKIPSPQQAITILLQHLKDENYDIGNFPVDIPIWKAL